MENLFNYYLTFESKGLNLFVGWWDEIDKLENPKGNSKIREISHYNCPPDDTVLRIRDPCRERRAV